MKRSPATLEVHDFRQPRQLLPASWRTLQLWCAAGCKLTSDRWTKLGLEVGIEHQESCVRTLRSALERLPDPAWGVHASMGADGVDTLLVAAPDRLRTMARRLLGDTSQETTNLQSLTAVEESMAELLLQELLQGLGDAWPGPAPLHCRIQDIVQEPQRTRLFAPRSTIVVVAFSVHPAVPARESEAPADSANITPRPSSADLYWLVPQAPLEDLIEVECSHPVLAPSAPHPALTRIMRDVPVSITVELGRTYLSMSELTSLQSGDVVILEQSVNRPLQVRMGDTFKFRGRPGRVGVRRCLEIEEVLDDASGSLSVSLPN